MKQVLLIAIFAFLLLPGSCFSQGYDGRIEIDKADQFCKKDKDCVFIPTDCGSKGCECPGRPINKKHEEKYVQLLQECQSKTGDLKVCKDPCTAPKLRCLNQHCISLADMYHFSSGQKL